MLDGFARDVRFGGRMLAKSPGFTTVAALSLALGIGANTTIFTLINAVRLKMLPVADPAQLVILRWWTPGRAPTPARSTWGASRTDGGRHSGTSFSYPAFEAIRDRNQAFSYVFGFVNLGRVSVAADAQPGLAQLQLVTPGAFDTLGLPLVLGRGIGAEDDKPGAQAVAVISHGYWQRRFGGDPAILGKSMLVNDKPVSVVGVTPACFTGINPGNADDMWMPLQTIRLIAPERVRDGAAFAQNDFWWVPIMGRLKPGIEAAAAQANVETVFKQMVMDGITVTGTPPVIPSVELTPGGQGIDQIRRELDTPLTIMMAVVFVVALIACANVANLLLARAAVRQKEIAIRLSLGTNRSRLVRQLLTESALLAGLGTALGFAIAFAGSRFMVGMMGRGDRPMTLDLSPDLTILAFTATAGALTTLVFGLAPALRATAIEPFTTLRESSAGAGGGKTIGLARALVVGQVALSLVLLAGAGLFVRTLHNLRSVDLGFEESGLLLFGVNGLQGGFKDAALADLYERIQTHLETVPGVQSATMTPFALLASSASNYSLTIPGYVPKADERVGARVLHVGSRFFETMGLRLALGRPLEARDREDAPLVAVANQTFVKRYLEGTTGLGRTFSFGQAGDKPVEIVGIANDARYDRIRGDIQAILYIPMRQNLRALSTAFFEVKTTREPLSIVPDVRKAVSAVNPSLPLFEIKTQTQQIDQLLMPERMFATLTTFFGLLALSLVCVGLYGIISYGVAMRTTEIGVRMALGARSEDIVRMVLRETASLVSKGVGIGLPIAFAAGHFAAGVVASLLFGLQSTDAMSLGVATLVMVLIGSLAGVLPARRASSVAPMSALRCE
jgi:predicted permease